jgi:hypothetical protein
MKKTKHPVNDYLRLVWESHGCPDQFVYSFHNDETDKPYHGQTKTAGIKRLYHYSTPKGSNGRKITESNMHSLVIHPTNEHNGSVVERKLIELTQDQNDNAYVGSSGIPQTVTIAHNRSGKERTFASFADAARFLKIQRTANVYDAVHRISHSRINGTNYSVVR